MGKLLDAILALFIGVKAPTEGGIESLITRGSTAIGCLVVAGVLIWTVREVGGATLGILGKLKILIGIVVLAGGWILVTRSMGS